MSASKPLENATLASLMSLFINPKLKPDDFLPFFPLGTAAIVAFPFDAAALSFLRIQKHKRAKYNNIKIFIVLEVLANIRPGFDSEMIE